MGEDEEHIEIGEVRHKTFTGSGARIHYRTAGAGDELVVCLHGFPQTGRCWEHLMIGMSDRFTVIAPDLRGAGESERPATGYDKKTLAGDIRELVHSLRHKRVHLVGHDIGSAVAYAYAAQWPDEVGRLVMMEMLLPGFGLEAMFAIRKPGEFAHMPFFMAQDLAEWLIAGREGAFTDWFIRNMVANQAAFGPDDIAAYGGSLARPGALRAGFALYRAFWEDAEDNRTFAKKKLPMPVLAIGGAMSLADAFGVSLEPLTASLQSLVFEDCGHFILEEQPARVMHELRSFLLEAH